MAVEIERLVAVLDARTDKLEKQFAKAGVVADRELAAIEQRGTRFAANMNTALASSARGFQASATNMGALKAQTANLGAQFQDIAVQLQSGTSPFTIALQQGTQISAVLGQAGAGGAVRALGGAFLSLLNPVSLLTIAIIAAGGAAVQYFSSILSEGEQSNLTIKEQEQLVLAVAQRWGDAVPSLQAYVDQLKRAKDESDLGAVTKSRIDAELADARAQLPDLLDEVHQLKIGLLSIGPEAAPSIAAIETAFARLEQKVTDGTVTLDDYRAAQEAVAQAQSLGIQSAGALAGMLTKLSGAWGAAISAARQYAADARTALAIQPSNTFLDPMQKMQMQGKEPTGGVSYDVTPKSWYKPSGGGGGRSGKSEAQREREQAAEAIKRERDAVKDLIDNLMFEASMVGKTSEEKAAANAVRRAGSAATKEEAEFIELATIALEQQEDAIEANKQAMQDMQDKAKGFLNDFFSGIEQGKSVWESFGDAALNVLNKITDKLLDDVLNAIFDVNGALGSGGGGGGLLGFLVRLFGGVSSPGISGVIGAGGGGLFASGGYTGPGSKNQIAGAVHAGEFVFSKEAVKRLGLGNLAALHAMGKAGFANGGFVGSIPSAVMPSGIGGGGGNKIVNHYSIDARGAVEGTAEQIRKAIEANNRNAVPQISVQSMQRAKKYGVTQ